MNGYFKIEQNDKGVSIRLIPPTEDGEKIRVAELREYLDRLGVTYDPMAINSALYQLSDTDVVLFLSPIKIPTVDEKCNIVIAEDKLSAVLRFYPGEAEGKPLTAAYVKELLDDMKIKYGIDEDAIERVLSEKKYCSDVIIAKGKLPTAGRDAKINYYFDTNNKARPELKEDGSVDFFKLNTLHKCTKGQVLAEIEPEERGEDGIDVFGTVSPAREVKRAKFSHGRNLIISEDGLQLMSNVDGHASLVDDTVFVADVYQVENVDPATGNIDYNGNVEVNGNVCENFSIKTDGNVFVRGVVEGATIEAGGNIIIARGMHGQNKGKLIAGGNVVAKFISAAEVTAKGFVEAEQILNARINAGESVHAEAGKGLITGGRVIAGKEINVKNAGSAMGAATILEVGSDPEVKKQYAQLQKDVAEKTKSLSQMKQIMAATAQKLQAGNKLTTEQVMNFKAIQQQAVQLQGEIGADLAQIEQMDEMMRFDENAHINVRGTMYQGVAVTISGVNMAVKSEYTYCRLVRKGADIASTNLI
ncbi:MAG: DUF342 domain-containing protein [Lachnospiraceae bacterium]|nr:DUF342 domain-containing protein [Lachnospiraceae bacterium]